MIKIKHIIVLLTGIVFSWYLYSQDTAIAIEKFVPGAADSVNLRNSETGQELYLSDTIHKRQFNKENWEKITKNLDYTEASEKSKPAKDKPLANHLLPAPGTSWGPVAGPLLIIIAVLALAFILYKFFSGRLSNTKINHDGAYSIEQVEERLHESDLERFLREAIESRKFRLAIRIYYLMVIKELSARDWIQWKKDKTNNQYLIEMSSRPDFALFREITRLFEYAWYGEMTVEESHFNLLSPRFREFLQRVKNMPG